MKKAAYYEEAKRLYVQDGFSLDAIEKLLKGEVSRRTMFTWKTENAWDEQRTRFLQSQAAMQDELMEIARNAIKEAKINPEARKILAVTKALYALKMLQSVKLDESVPEEVKKNIRPETIKQIEEEFGLSSGQDQSGGK